MSKRNQLSKAILSGDFRGLSATAVFVRDGSQWILTVSIDSVGRPESFRLKKDVRPCWSVALDFLNKIAAQPIKPQRERTEAQPEPFVPRVHNPAGASRS